MTPAFDADVVIYASISGHHLGRRVKALFTASAAQQVGMGSLLLLPEVLSKPMRQASREDEVDALLVLLQRLHLHPLDEAIADLSVTLGAKHRLRAPDAVHLATAVRAGADRFITNNRRDFPKTIAELDVTYPEDLPDPS